MPIILPDNPYWDWYDDLPDTEGVVFDWDRRRPYTRRHLVKVKVKEMGPIDVALLGSAYPGTLPQPGSAYTAPGITPGAPPMSYDTDAIIVHQSAKRRDADPACWEYWIVTSEYDTRIPSRQDNPNSDRGNPENDLADIHWDFEQIQEAKYHDLVGTPYVDTAFTPFLRPPMTEQDYQILSISRNEITYNYATASYYTRSLNDADFLGAPRGCVQCLPPKADQKNRGVLRYWRTSYRLRFRPMQFNYTGSTDKEDLFKLPPLNVYLPRTTGGTDINKSNTGRTGTAGLPDALAAAPTALGQCIGTFQSRANGMVYYDPIPASALLQAKLLSDRGLTTPEWLRSPQRIWDSWQPLIQLQSLNRLGSEAAGDVATRWGKTLPIKDEVSKQPIHHPRLIDPYGQEVKSLDRLTFPPEPPQPWFVQFVNYRYTNLKKLLVKGLT